MPSDPFIGEIFMAGFNYAPQGYVLCQGQLMSISQNSAMFALLGTTFGGDGMSTFGIPDLRGRVPLSSGPSPSSGTNFVLGQVAGSETVTLNVTQMPAHTHTVIASNDAGDTASPSGAFAANTGALDKEYKASLTNAVTMNGAALNTAGNSLPHPNMQPYVALTFYIATQGLFPSRP